MRSEDLKNYQNIGLLHEESAFFGNVDGLSLQNIFYVRNQAFPGCYLFDYNRRKGDNRFDVEAIWSHLSETVPEDEKMELIPYFTKNMDEKDEYSNLILCIILNKSQVYARIEKSVSESYVLFNNKNIEAAKKFVRMLQEFYITPKEDEAHYYRLAVSQSGYYLEKGDVKVPSGFDIRKQYEDTFVKEDEKIRKFIEAEDKSGLVILHGEKGTGKSTYIKYLVDKYIDKKFVYVPSSFISLMGDPSFGSFLSTLSNHIIILEDCENAIRDRKASSSASAVSLLLNMTDGLLADDLGIKFICTFNEDMKAIDTALLRKGRLISKYEFKPLSVGKAAEILKEMECEFIPTKPMSLADIFHCGEDSYETSKTTIMP